MDCDTGLRRWVGPGDGMAVVDGEMTCGCGGRRPSMVLATVDKSAASLEVVSLELLPGKSVDKCPKMFAFESIHIETTRISLLEWLMSDETVNKSGKHPRNNRIGKTIRNRRVRFSHGSTERGSKASLVESDLQLTASGRESSCMRLRMRICEW